MQAGGIDWGLVAELVYAQHLKCCVWIRHAGSSPAQATYHKIKKIAPWLIQSPPFILIFMDEPQTSIDTDSEEEVTQQNNNHVSSDGSADVLLNLESLIKSHITTLDRLKEEIKVNQEMLNSYFENDPDFQEQNKKIKEETKVRTEIKQRILKQSQPAQLNEKIKASKADVKEMDKALSDYLSEYQRMSGVNEIECEDGEVREIVYTAKLIKKFRQSLS